MEIKLRREKNKEQSVSKEHNYTQGATCKIGCKPFRTMVITMKMSPKMKAS